MSKNLLQEIINHIFNGFSILNPLDNGKFKSLKSSEYLLSDKLSFEDEAGNLLKNNVWGVQFKLENNDFKILLGDCSVDKNVLEYALVVKLAENPAYGLYSAYSTTDKVIDSCPLIAVSVDNQNWMTCNTYFQATFLAGMETAKDLAYTATYCSNYQEHFNILTSFIKFHNQLFGENS